jgi:DNA topoisomerase I
MVDDVPPLAGRGIGNGLVPFGFVEIAEELANTPTVCRVSYVHDAVITAFEAGALRRAKKAKSPVALAEHLARIVAKHAG